MRKIAPIIEYAQSARLATLAQEKCNTDPQTAVGRNLFGQLLISQFNASGVS